MALSSTPRPEATSGLLRDPSSRGRPSAAAPVSRLSLRDGSRHLYRKHGSSQSTGKALGGRERRQVWPPSVSTGAKPEPGAVQISDTRAVYVSPAQPASDRERPQAADESADELASASASGPENVGEPRPAAASAVREQLEAVENQPQEPVSVCHGMSSTSPIRCCALLCPLTFPSSARACPSRAPHGPPRGSMPERLLLREAALGQRRNRKEVQCWLPY